jgi:hypothetical protein
MDSEARRRFDEFLSWMPHREKNGIGKEKQLTTDELLEVVVVTPGFLTSIELRLFRQVVDFYEQHYSKFKSGASYDLLPGGKVSVDRVLTKIDTEYGSRFIDVLTKCLAEVYRRQQEIRRAEVPPHIKNMNLS